MAELVRADAARSAAILDETWSIWHEGLTREAFGRWVRLQEATEWGRRHLSRVALVGADGATLASAKWYDLEAVLDGEPIRVCGIGAVFTALAHRGQGYARQLIEAIADRAAHEGCHALALFSEIGPSYYAGMGFVEIPRETLTLGVTFPREGAPATLVRAGTDADLAHLAELDRVRTRFGVVRSPASIQFGVAKRRALAASAPHGRRAVEFFVTEEGLRAVAYVLISRGPSGNLGDGPDVMWLEACGDRDPSGARVGAILQVLRARTPAESWPPLLSWLPSGWLPPQLTIDARQPAADILMMRPLGKNSLPPLTAADVTWPHADAF
jgi:GNAT superfamily N-acetyltransferase